MSSGSSVSERKSPEISVAVTASGCTCQSSPEGEMSILVMVTSLVASRATDGSMSYSSSQSPEARLRLPLASTFKNQTSESSPGRL